MSDTDKTEPVIADLRPSARAWKYLRNRLWTAFMAGYEAAERIKKP